MATATLSPNGCDRYRSAAPPDTILVATMDGAVELARTGAGWREAGRSLGGLHVSSLLALGERTYAGTHESGVFERNGAGPWANISDGLTSTNVYSLASADVDGRHVLYAGTEPALIFARTGGTGRWTELPAIRSVAGRDKWDFPVAPHEAHVKHLDPDPRFPQTFYIAVEQGALLKTDDGGRTVRELPFHDASYFFNKDTHRVAVNPFDPDEIYLTGGDGISRSRDAGETWERVTTRDMDMSYPDAIFCSPLDDGVLYAAGAGGRPGNWRKTGSADALFMRSTDRGATWQQFGLPVLRGNIEAVTLLEWPGDYGFAAGTTDGEVFVSTDRGATWTTATSSLPAISKGVHANNVLVGRAHASA